METVGDPPHPCLPSQTMRELALTPMLRLAGTISADEWKSEFGIDSAKPGRKFTDF